MLGFWMVGEMAECVCVCVCICTQELNVRKKSVTLWLE